MKVVSKGGKHFAYFEIDRDTAIEYAKKLDTHNFNITVHDPRVRTNDQVKFFWALLDEFCAVLFPEDKLTKQQKESLKEALYAQYNEDNNINVNLSTSSLLDIRLFLEYVIKEFAEKYKFVPQNILLQNEFTEKYVYACLFNNKCAVCQSDKNVIIRSIRNKHISLCTDHAELKEKELIHEHHLTAIPLSENVLNVLKGNDVE